MIKYFKTNKEYFIFYENNKDRYRIIKVKPLKNSIKVEYDEK